VLLQINPWSLQQSADELHAVPSSVEQHRPPLSSLQAVPASQHLRSPSQASPKDAQA